ncbi:MaoC family dehydratase [Azospirillum sp. RWY-5-1]|uniref:MaoC family dehydratase n=1 Tax=Azospirillum oleiclasticum TaxID=2735135 RepID=A0ABX2TJH4_9PROT|nr:MaoC family dehydratase [Azospirillum oleiclasticum]NYZ14598.1 MaoC family dehydratase [Azospirillum oleiclasticum]NYZ24376.1 MaoC family dehydratase [Azospirillum oleiclasticum]
MMTLPRAEYEARVGQEIGISRWIEITQDRIDRFAECSGDRQFIHVDPERARATPFGGTIAQGFLTLSMIAEMLQDIPRIEGATMGVNYGLNRVRFVAPVPVGSRVRGRFVLTRLEDIRPGELQTTMTITVEIEGIERPALVAEWLARRHVAVC